MRWNILLIIILLAGGRAQAQGLFEQAVSGSASDSVSEEGDSFELNGYIRGDIYGGKTPGLDQAELKSGYAEASMKFRASKGEWGDGYAEIRFRSGREFGESIDEFELREAYAAFYHGPFDFFIGRQIVVWGRADGFNPTDNINPKNMLVRSPNEDDRRLGNFLIRTYYNHSPWRLEAVWVPFFEGSVIPVNLISFPAWVEMAEPVYPDERVKNGAFALRLEMIKPSIEGSISYFTGYNPFPGISISVAGSSNMIVAPKAYRLRVIGADFSTTIAGKLGLRGEFAYRKPDSDYIDNIHIPYPDLQYTLGLDREFPGNFSVILQYIGRYVLDFERASAPTSPAETAFYRIAEKNRMIASQLDEVSHSVSFRPAWNLLYETLIVEALGLYNVTTEELFLRPKMTYHLADALTMSGGIDYYRGPDGTLYDIIDSHLSSVFFELKASF